MKPMSAADSAKHSCREIQSRTSLAILLAGVQNNLTDLTAKDEHCEQFTSEHREDLLGIRQFAGRNVHRQHNDIGNDYYRIAMRRMTHILPTCEHPRLTKREHSI